MPGKKQCFVILFLRVGWQDNSKKNILVYFLNRRFI